MTKSIQSIEPKIAELANEWLKSYNLNYKLEQESLNREIDKALNDYHSKNGGTGGNRPDVKLLLRNKDQKDIPILIEYKGYIGKVEFDDEAEESGQSALFYLKILSLVVVVVGFGLYIGDVLFGKSSLDILLNLQADKDTLTAKIKSLKDENAVLQKEYFELRQLDPDR